MQKNIGENFAFDCSREEMTFEKAYLFIGFMCVILCIFSYVIYNVVFLLFQFIATILLFFIW